MGIVLSIYGKAIVRILMIRIEYVVGTQIITTKKYFCPCRACRQSRTERQCKCSIIYNAIAINQGYGQLQDNAARRVQCQVAGGTQGRRGFQHDDAARARHRRERPLGETGGRK